MCQESSRGFDLLPQRPELYIIILSVWRIDGNISEKQNCQAYLLTRDWDDWSHLAFFEYALVLLCKCNHFGVHFTFCIIPWKQGKNYWRGCAQDLESFKAQYGHCNVSQATKDSAKLGRWLHQQVCLVGLKHATWFACEHRTRNVDSLATGNSVDCLKK
jgi:hypothetical protein